MGCKNVKIFILDHPVIIVQTKNFYKISLLVSTPGMTGYWKSQEKMERSRTT
jgi:hypothetical protein